MQFFRRDIFLLLAVSILLGTALAKAVSYGANAYFQQTLVSLVGDYGEYDLLVQMREEHKETGLAQMEKMLREALGGAPYKEGPAIIGKANLFIALPKEKKTKYVYENIDKFFAAIPGVTGVSIITEPRLLIRGVPAGAAEALESELESVEGVAFVYRSGGAIGVVLDGVDRIQEVTGRTEAALTRSKIIEVSFPVGAEPDNPVALAERMTRGLYEAFAPQTAQYVSVDTQNDDIVYLVSTLKELRGFLVSYRTQATVSPYEKGKLGQGDELVFQGAEAQPPQRGEAVRRGNVLVRIMEVRQDGALSGVIVQGDAADVKGREGYLIADGRVGAAAATARFENPRARIVEALRYAADTAEKLPALAKEGRAMSALAMETLRGYGESAGDVKGMMDGMDAAVASMNRAAAQLEAANVRGLKEQLAQASRSMEGLVRTLQVVRVFTPDVANAVHTLESTREKVAGLSELLGGMERVTAQAVEARDALQRVASDGRRAADALEGFEGSRAQRELASVNEQLSALTGEDFQAFAKELRLLADRAPLLSDEEIHRSLQLMDKMIEGQLLPGKKIQIMVDRGLWLDQVKPVLYQAVGHENVGVFEADLGVIEPNVYLQVYQVLGEVKAVLAGFTALVMTLFFLALDHTAVMSALHSRRRKAQPRGRYKGWRGRLEAAALRLVYVESLYGMAAGALLFGAMFFLAGGGIPYAPWYVAPLLGAALGFFAAQITERIAPVSEDEILAGQSLGMSFEEIMREIVIPGARPGLLQRLNRRRLKFK